MSELAGRGLSYERGNRIVFEGVDVTARSGQPLAVMGPSGSGKTSLLTILSGLEAPSAGTVTLDGQPLTLTLRRRFATVLQGNALVSLLTATENVEVAMRAAGTPHKQAVQRAAELIGAVGLDEFGDHLVEELSGGQQQRVAIARALAVEPDVLFADEPTSDQDSSFRDLVVDLLFERADAGAIVVVATHDPAVSGRCADTLRVEPAGEPAR